jgi:hypothetical protein
VFAEAGRAEDVLDREIDERDAVGHESTSEGASVGPITDATLAITRNAPDDVQDRTVNLWLDGESWDTLRYGVTITRSIQPGPHRLKAHNTLFGTELAFEAKPGEHVRVRCTNAMTGSGMMLMVLIGWAMLRVRLEREA